MRGRPLLALVCAAVCGGLVFAGGAAAAGVPITVTEGLAFTKKVDDAACAGFLRATISWGDGSPNSTGTTDGSATGMQGTHTYADQGLFNGSVTYDCPRFRVTDHFQATVRDAPLTAAGRDIAGNAGNAVGGVVAHFSDANPVPGAGDFSAQITWGDGAKTVGQVASAAGGGFDVSGTHTYTDPGSYAVSTSIADVGGSTASTSSAAAISAPPPPPAPPTQLPPPATELTANFRVLPSSPCPDTEMVLDASASTGAGGAPISRYAWTIVMPRGNGPTQFVRDVTTDPVDRQFYVPYYAELGDYRGQLDHVAPDGNSYVYDIYDYRLLRPPVQVLLRVEQDVPGSRTPLVARQVQTVTFTNPDITQQVGYATALDWFPPGISAPGWIVNPGKRSACPPITYRSLFGAVAVKNSVALANITRALVKLSPAGQTITFKTKCNNPIKDCLALVDVITAGAATSRAARVPSARRAHRLLPNSVGTKTLVVPAGRTVTVSVPLNTRGKALARSRRLHRITLLLASMGAEGKVVKTKRTATLRVQR